MYDSVQFVAGTEEGMHDMLACIYVCMHTGIYAYLHVCMHACMMVCMHA